MASNAFNLSNVALTSSSSSNATIVTFTGNLLAQSLEVQGSYVPPNGIYLPAANTIGFTTGSSERVRIASAGQIGIAGANYGTSGQVLTSGGTSAAPTWSDPAGGGATGGGSDKVFIENDLVVTTDYSIPATKNAGTFGPITVNSGVTVTVPSSSTWSIV